MEAEKYLNNPNSIKYHVKKFIEANPNKFHGKKVVDFPAGNGITSSLLIKHGCEALPFDLFPEYFQVPNVECKKANIFDGIPLPSETADAVICQEGIEHFQDQIKPFQEFNRILKPGGSLIITTPNYSNLRAKISYLLSESERFGSMMPPNEIDSIWMAKGSSEIYYGHIFLLGIQKLRLLGSLTGFKIKKIVFTRLKTTSLLFFPIFYPFIFLFNTLAYFNNISKRKAEPVYQRKIYLEIYQLSINPKILLDGHLFVEFEKIEKAENVGRNLKSVHQNFGVT